MSEVYKPRYSAKLVVPEYIKLYMGMAVICYL